MQTHPTQSRCGTPDVTRTGRDYQELAMNSRCRTVASGVSTRSGTSRKRSVHAHALCDRNPACSREWGDGEIRRWGAANPITPSPNTPSSIAIEVRAAAPAGKTCRLAVLEHAVRAIARALDGHVAEARRRLGVAVEQLRRSCRHHAGLAVRHLIDATRDVAAAPRHLGQAVADEAVWAGQRLGPAARLDRGGHVVEVDDHVLLDARAGAV